jgi:hypothetical protein
MEISGTDHIKNEEVLKKSQRGEEYSTDSKKHEG